MRICIPVENKDGQNSKLSQHFGSAKYFAIYDTENQSFELIENDNSHHAHGMCHPLSQLEGKKINAVVCGGMGMRALQSLNAGGIKAFMSQGKSVKEVLEKHGQNLLEEMTVNNACKQHGCH
jgi:predicted Fe-Mo cluster-binding NifX family protein